MRKSMPPIQRAALYIAFKAGVLQQCTRHWVYFRSQNSNALEHAYRLGNYLISHFARVVKAFKGDRKRMTDAINQCHQKAPHCCEQCMAVQMVRVQ